MNYKEAIAKSFEGPERIYEIMEFKSKRYCLLAKEVQDIRLGNRVSLTEVWKPISQQRTYKPSEKIKLRNITSPTIREGLLKIIKINATATF